MKKALLVGIFSGILISLSAQNQSFFRDDFDSNKNSWVTKTESDYSANVKDGEYEIVLKKETWTWWLYTTCPINPNKPFTINSEFQFKKGSSKATFGIAWDVVDKESNLVFEIRKDGKCAYYRKKEGEIDYLKNWTDCGKTIDFNESHLLTVKYTGSTYEFLLDGNKLFSASYSRISHQNYVGFYVENNVTVGINYLDVLQDRGKLNVVDDGDFKPVEKENLGSKINTVYTEKRPIISADGKTLYFTREGDPDNIGDPEADDIWVADLGPDGLWGQAYNIGRPLNNKDNNSMVGAANDNSWMVLKTVYTPEGEFKEKGFSMSHKVNGKWTVPEKIDVKNFYNKNKYQEAHINPEGNVLILAIETDETNGGKDIYFSKKQADGSWSEPKNCGSVLNSFADEIGPFMAGDGKTLYFASEGHPGYGDADIFMSKRLDDTWMNWSEPVNMGPSINTAGWDAYFSTDQKGEWGYMVSTENSIGKLDIFRFRLPEKVKPEVRFMIKGVVINASTKEPMLGKIQFRKLDNDSLITEIFAGGADGKFEFEVKEGVQYAVVGDYPGYIGERLTIDFTGLEESTEKEVVINLKPIEQKQTIELNNIFFQPDKAEILYTSRSELHHVANLMKEHPEMEIIIGGHAMDTGMSPKQSMKLSRQRAKAVYDYLTDLGVPKKRMKYVGYGDSKPVYEEESSSGKNGNRCVSFEIVKM